MNKPPNILVLGGLNMGLIARAERLPKPGETLCGNRFYHSSGGKGATQAVAAARLGAQVAMVGRVGDDLFGPALLDALRHARETLALFPFLDPVGDHLVRLLQIVHLGEGLAGKPFG